MRYPGNANDVRQLLERKEMSIQPPEKAQPNTGAKPNPNPTSPNGLRFGLGLSGYFFFFSFRPRKSIKVDGRGIVLGRRRDARRECWTDGIPAPAD